MTDDEVLKLANDVLQAKTTVTNTAWHLANYIVQKHKADAQREKAAIERDKNRFGSHSTTREKP